MKKIFLFILLVPMFLFQNCGNYGPDMLFDVNFNEEYKVEFEVGIDASKKKSKLPIDDCGVIIFKNTDRQVELKPEDFKYGTIISECWGFKVYYEFEEEDYDKNFDVEYYCVIDGEKLSSESSINLYQTIRYKMNSEFFDNNDFVKHICDVCEVHYIKDIYLEGESEYVHEANQFFTVDYFTYTPGTLTVILVLERQYDTSDLSFIKVYFNNNLVNATSSFENNKLTLNIEYIDYTIGKIKLEMDDTKKEDTVDDYAYVATLSNPDYDEITVTITLKEGFTFDDPSFKYNGENIDSKDYKIEGNVLTYTYRDPHWSPIY